MTPKLIPGKRYTPWMVRFPPPTGRKFFKTEEEAKKKITDFFKGRTKARFSDRELDELLRAKALLRPPITTTATQ